MPTLYETAKNFDKSYDRFRTDVQVNDEGIVFVLGFRRLAGPYVTRKSASIRVRDAFTHQVRPFGRTTMFVDDPDETVELRFLFREKKITDVGLRGILTKLVAFADQVATEYNFDP